MKNFNLLNRLQSTTTKPIPEEETSKPDKEQSIPRKRKHNELESSFTTAPLQNRLSTYSTSKLVLQPIDAFSNIDKKEVPRQQTYAVSENTKLQAFETLEKYLIMDERYIENDKNIGSSTQSK
jgi:hypothetical protein